MPRRSEETDRELLERTHRIAEENYHMLQKMRRDAWIGFFIKLAIWAVVLGLPVYLYFTFLQPIMGDLFGFFSQLQGGAETLQQIVPKLQQLLQTTQQ